MKLKKMFSRRGRNKKQQAEETAPSSSSSNHTPLPTDNGEPSLYWSAKTTNEFLPDDFGVTMPCKRPLPLGGGTLSLSGTAVSEFHPAGDLLATLSRDSCASESTAFFSAVAPEEDDEFSVSDNEQDLQDELGEMDVFRKQQSAMGKPRSFSSSSLSSSPTSTDKIVFDRNFSSFLRVADLCQEVFREEEETLACSSVDADSVGEGSPRYSSSRYPNFHHMAVDPPPGVALDPKERWVVLDDGCGEFAPVAPTAVRALARSGFKSSFDMPMWVADSKTAKTLRTAPEWNHLVWQSEGKVVLPEGLNESECFVWSGNFAHGHYGSDLPAVRSAGIIDMNPRALLDLLVDSSRVKEYNKLCVGRTDLLTLQSDAELEGGVFGGVTKVMKTESQPPMLRSTLQFTSLMHARKLEDGSGYKMVTRAVTLPETKEDLANTLKSEILLGATILKCVEGQDNKCLFISVNHLRSPMVPTMIAKRIGLSAAVNFIGDLRAVAAKGQ